MNNIFLTGEKQVGKSAIINKIIVDYNEKVCGFKTLLENTEYRRFYLESISLNNRTTEKNYISKRTEEGYTKGIIEAFDGFGTVILSECLASSPSLIVMDELGVFEKNAFLFQEMVYKCLDSAIPVLGVLKAKSSPFLDSIKNRKDVKIFYVNHDNRETQYKKVLESLKIYLS